MSVVFNSILDNDFYKFTMQCAVVKLFPDARVKYEFINRGKHFFIIEIRIFMALILIKSKNERSF